MDGVIGRDEARALVGNAALWPRVRDFLWDFAPQVHESWLGSSVVRWLGGEESSQPSNHSTTPPPNHQTLSSPRVKRYILESLGVEPCFHAFPKEDGSRLLLLDAATLESLVRWLGALACAEELRKITDGATVKTLKAALPGVYPDVFGYTAYFAFGSYLSHAETQRAQRLDETIVRVGYEILFSIVANQPSALVSRFKLKFPKNLCDLCRSATLRETEKSRVEIKFPTILKLLKLKFPEAYSLCCL